MLPAILNIFQDLGLLALLTLGVLAIRPLAESLSLQLLRTILLGAMFGGLAVAVMLDPIPLPAGAVTDARGGPAILAGVFGGPVAALVAAGIGAAARYWLVGGPVALGGAVGFILYGLAGVLAGWTLRQWDLKPSPAVLALIGAFGTVLVLPSFFVSADWATGLTILGKAWPILATANVISTVLVGLVLRYAESRALRWTYHKTRAEEADTLALAVEHTTNGVLIADRSGTVTWLNAGFRRLTGLRDDQVLSLPLAAVLNGTLPPHCNADAMTFQGTSDSASRHVLSGRTPDGRRFWADVAFQPVRIGGVIRHSVAVLTDITEQKVLEQRLLRAEQVAHVGHWHLTPQTDVVTASDETRRIFEFALEGPAPGLHGFLDAYHPDDRARVTAVVEASLRTGGPLDFRARLLVNDTIKWVDVKGETEHDDAGQVCGLFGVVQDVTLLAQSEMAAHQAREVADAANKSKSDFLATMSHELRTPLNAVLGFSEIIAGQYFGPVQGDPRYLSYAEDIRYSGTLLLDLVNDVLDLSKIEAGRFDMDEELVAIPDVVERALRMVRERAARNRIELRLSGVDDAPRLWADIRLVTQMLFNLLTNAVKFTPAGGTITILADSIDGGAVALCVRDTGIGMAPEEIARVTQPYYQVRGARVRAVHEGGAAGTGLGLTLVSRMMVLHDGRLDLESAPGQGTMARLVFPSKRVRPSSA